MKEEERGSKAAALFFIFIFIFVAVCNGLLAVPDGSRLRVAAALGLLLIPGVVWAGVLLPYAGRPTRWVVGLGIGYALVMVSGLLLHYLPGPVGFWQELAALDVLALAPALVLLAAGWDRPAQARPDRYLYVYVLVAVLLVGGFFRFFGLGYSEFQGDEIKAMLPAARALEGDPDALFEGRKKGPGEVLLPMMLWRLTGTVDEGAARLPFAAAGLMAVPTAYLLGRKLLEDREGKGGKEAEEAGLTAAALLALNGLLVAFSRIVQYQGVVAWMSLLSILCAWEWRESGRTLWAALCGVFFGVGLLAHYDALAVAPALAYVGLDVLFRARRGAAGPANRVASLSVGLCCAVVAAGLFYVPYALGPQAEQAQTYLLYDRIGEGLLKNSLDVFIYRNIFYGSFYYLAVTGLAVLGLVAWAIHHLPPLRRLPGGRWWVPSTAALVVLGLMAYPEFRVLGVEPAFYVFAAVLCVVLVSPALTQKLREVALWLAFAFLVSCFFIKDPDTHVFVAVLPWVLLAGVMAAKLRGWAGFRRAGVVFAAGYVLLASLFGGYLYAAYLRVDPEFWEDWPDSRVSLYWAPPPYDELPGDDLFGIVHKSGWKWVGALYERGELSGSYDTTEKPEVTVWYGRDAYRVKRTELQFCGDWPEYYFIPDDLVESLGRYKLEPGMPESAYDRIGRIELPNGKGMTFYQARPRADETTLPGARELEREFDRTAVPSAFTGRPPQPDYPADVNLHGAVRLTGYDLDLRRAFPGGRVGITLFWRAEVDVPVELHVFVHVEGASGVVGQSNGTPGCGLYPTYDWKTGQTFVDPHSVPIPPDTPPGDYSLRVGMYLPVEGTRLNVLDGAGNPAGTSAELTTVPVSAR